MSDFENPDASWYFDQYEKISAAGGRVSREQFVSTCHIFRAAGYNEALTAAGSERTAALGAVLAEEYASTQICYRTTTPTAFHSALRDAFLAGYEASAATQERT